MSSSNVAVKHPTAEDFREVWEALKEIVDYIDSPAPPSVRDSWMTLERARKALERTKHHVPS